MNEKWKIVISENIKSFLFALVIALFIRSFVVEPYKIPSGSMKPTLLVGDYIFITKYSYGYSRYSLPFYPKLWSGRIMDYDKPQRGDIIVFKGNADDSIYYIKRLVGLPGDAVQMKGGVLYINGESVPKMYMGDFSDEELHKIPMFNEKLDNLIHKTIDQIAVGPLDNTQEFMVPDDHYFFMGDNRDGSNDSRLDIGFVPYEKLVGKARIIFFSVKGSLWDIAGLYNNIRYSRLFSDLYAQ